ncbi:MAG TPA: hypothetical protein VFX02_08820 [Gammaproteobacteria bacterium]|nr:hypothetical protein [Gammaproteobacteria bacterium]
MSLVKVATGKVEVELVRIHAELDSQVEEMYRANASKGKLKSGETMQKTLDICDTAFQRLRNLLNAHFSWIFNESVIVTQTDVDLLKEIARTKFKEIYEKAAQILRRSAELSGKPDIYGFCLPKLTASMKNSEDQMILFIDGEALVKRNRGARRFFNIAFGWISKLFKYS